MKKALSVLLAIAMVLTVVQVGIFSASALQEGDYTYTVSGSEATITGYTGSGGNIVIPDQLGGFPVRFIAENSFASKSTLTGVVIPDSVTEIYTQAFRYCQNLQSVTFGTEVTVIGQSAFDYAVSLTDVILPEKLSHVSGGAFSNCTALTKVVIPNASATIGMYAFEFCTSLTSVTIGTGVNLITSYAFKDCPSLTAAYFMGNAPSMFPSVFVNCSALFTVYYVEGNPSFPDNWNGYNTAAFTPFNTPTFTANPTFPTNGNVTVTIMYPSGAATAEYKRMGGNWQAYTAPVVLSDNDEVFARCCDAAGKPSLVGSIIVNNINKLIPSFTSFPEQATNGNVTVTIIYAETATIKEYKIGTGNWTSYTAPLVITENSDVWARCSDALGNTSPETLYSVTNIDRIAPMTPTLEADPQLPTSGIVTITVTYPGDAAAREVKVGDKDWTEYTDPVVLDVNNTVCARCFDEAGNVSETGSIVINYIGFYDYEYTVFHGETIITAYHGTGGDVVIPDTLGTFPVVAIDNNAFEYCNTLTSVVIPDTVLSIGEQAFYRCEGLTRVTLPAGLLKIYGSAFAGCILLGSITFPAGVVNIADMAFYGCENLEWAVFVGAAPAMGTGVFDECTSGFFVYYFDKTGFDDPWYYKALPFEPEISASPTTPTNSNVTVTIKYPEPATIKEYKIDAGAWLAYAAPIILTANGTVFARCTDEFGNQSPESAISITNIDKVPPAAPILSASPEYDTTGYVTVAVAFPADAAVKQYALDSDGGHWQTYTGPIVLWAEDKVYARCFDAVGNESATESIKVTNFITISEGIIEKRGSTTVINPNENYIYGLAPGLTQDEFEHDYIETVGEVKIYYTPETEPLGTGTRVDVYNGFEELIASYYIVIFGDINGDGSIDSLDAGTAVDVENYVLKWDPPFDEIMPFAGDINGDGSIDSLDAGIMVDAENYAVTISQVSGRVV